MLFSELFSTKMIEKKFGMSLESYPLWLSKLNSKKS